MMTNRQRLLTVLRGGKADRIPVTIYHWLLPDTPAGKRLHAQGLIPIGSRRVFRERHRDVTIRVSEVTHRGTPQTLTVIETPVGTLTQRSSLDPTYGSRWIHEHLVKSVDDYRVMQFVFEHTEIEPAYEDYRAADAMLGDRGIVLGEILPIPVQWLLVEVMGTPAWSEGVLLHQERFDELLRPLNRLYQRQVQIAAESPAEVIWLPDNVTGTVMSPDCSRDTAGPSMMMPAPCCGRPQNAHLPITTGPTGSCALVSPTHGWISSKPSLRLRWAT